MADKDKPLKDDSKDFDPPQHPDPAEVPMPPEAPASIDADAVKTVGGLKYGWQEAPLFLPKNPIDCAHMGTISAKGQLRQHAVGHEWLCVCGQMFVVSINSGGKKVLVEKESDNPTVPELIEEVP